MNHTASVKAIQIFNSSSIPKLLFSSQFFAPGLTGWTNKNVFSTKNEHASVETININEIVKTDYSTSREKVYRLKIRLIQLAYCIQQTNLDDTSRALLRRTNIEENPQNS